MKELSREELLKHVKALYEYHQTSDKLKNELESAFPELKGSKDERMRKNIKIALMSMEDNLSDFYSTHHTSQKELLIWLEKQGEHLENYDEAEKEKADFVGDGFIECHADFLDFKEGNTYWLEYIGDDKYNVRSDNLLGKTYHITPCQLYTVFKKLTWLEKQGQQQKSANSYCQENCKGFQETGKCFFDWDCKAKREAESIDKAEPKFHEDEWVVNNTTKEIFKITELIDFGYESIDENGKTHTLFIDENEYHLWTIQDAKNGDVLVNKNGCPFIFKETKTCWCYYSISCGVFHPKSNKWFFSSEDYLCPATKEQRDFLFMKMKEAGYSWDSEKKELRKIEQEPAEWSEEDSYMLRQAIKCVNNSGKLDVSTEEIENWLKTLKPQPKNEWSREDEDMKQSIIDILTRQGFQTQINWLRSLRSKPHWKPTEEQLDALMAADTVYYYYYAGHSSKRVDNQHKQLTSLYYDLKKL